MTNFHEVFVVWKDASVPVALPHEQVTNISYDEILDGLNANANAPLWESIGIPENGILCLNDGGGTNYIPFGLFKEGKFVPGLDLSHWDAYPLGEDFQFIIFPMSVRADSPLDPVPDPTLPLTPPPTPPPSVSSRGKAPPAPVASP